MSGNHYNVEDDDHSSILGTSSYEEDVVQNEEDDVYAVVDPNALLSQDSTVYSKFRGKKRLKNSKVWQYFELTKQVNAIMYAICKKCS